MKYLVIVGFTAIIGSLAAALVYMLKGGQPDGQPPGGGGDAARRRRMARALAFRVGFSILLFVIVLVSYLMGWIQPTGLPLRN